MEHSGIMHHSFPETRERDEMKDYAPLIEKWLLFDATEDSYAIEEVRGTVPEWLRGAYYLNGPSRFRRNGFQYRHWLDGDGMVRALFFTDDGIHFVSRFVSTRKLAEETEQGRPLYRTFGTAFEGDRLRRGVMLEPPVNVSVYPLGSRLLAFAEQSIPIELDPRTLETIGEFDFNGKLNEVSPFSAHAKFDPATGRMANFGISFSSTQPVLYLYEFEPDGSLAGRRRFPVEAPHTNHDFALSERFALFFLSPLEMDFERFWRKGASVMESLAWRPEKGSYIYAVPRVSCDAEPFIIKRDSGHCLHLINAFEEGSRIHLDLVEFERPIYPEYQPVPDFYRDIDLGRPVRYVIDSAERRLIERREMSYNRGPDFPSVDPRKVGGPYHDFWLLGISAAGKKGRKFFDQLAHGDWRRGGVADLYQASAGRYLGGEPVYVGHPEREDEGLIIVQEFEAVEDRVSFLLINAHEVGKGPVARLPLQRKTHPGFHASFHPPS
jgi:all-trans-8'-apo-beta-carotenal 15,15'-oxygenase